MITLWLPKTGGWYVLSLEGWRVGVGVGQAKRGEVWLRDFAGLVSMVEAPVDVLLQVGG